jgi:hypothetical protein
MGVQHLGPGLRHLGPGLKQLDPGLKHLGPGLKQLGPGLTHLGPGLAHLGPGLKILVPGLEPRPFRSPIFRHNLPKFFSTVQTPMHAWPGMLLQAQQHATWFLHL